MTVQIIIVRYSRTLKVNYKTQHASRQNGPITSRCTWQKPDAARVGAQTYLGSKPDI
jgi:hypothetical protein